MDLSLSAASKLSRAAPGQTTLLSAAKVRASNVGYSIPVIYLACDRSDLPATLNRWTDAESVIAAADADRAKYKMCMATARNWWQLLAITEIRDRESCLD